jgi:hypothetical protein
MAAKWTLIGSVACPVLLALLLAPNHAPAQASGRSDWRDWVILDSEPRALDWFTENCPDLMPQACLLELDRLAEDCETVHVKELGEVEGRELYWVQYRRSRTYGLEYPEGKEVWRCEADEALIIESMDDGAARAIWYDGSERESEFIDDVALVRPEGREEFLISIQYCLNGTGGCSELILIRMDGRWRELQHDASWERVYAEIPEGYHLHKSPRIDLTNLRWERTLLGPGESNCGPSGRLFLELDILDGKLSVRDYEVRTGAE